MAKYMDAAGIRALAESAKSYFAAIDDLESTNQIQERLVEIMMQDQETFNAITSLLQIILGRTSSAKIFSPYQDPAAYNITSAMGMAVAPPVPVEATELTCKNDCGVRYFPDSYIPNVESLATSFALNRSLEVIGQIYAPACTTMQLAFNGCTKLAIIEGLYAPNCTDTWGMFMGCSSLKHIGRLHLGALTAVTNMFYGANIETVPEIDTSNVSNMGYMFYRTTGMRRIEGLSVKSHNSTTLIFRDCGEEVQYAIIRDIGSQPTQLDLSALAAWGTGGTENRESLRASLMDYSCDSIAGIRAVTLSAASYDALTSDERLAIQAKGISVIKSA